MATGPRCGQRERSGAILLTVLVVIAMITIGATAYFDWTFTEFKATRMFGRQTQATYAAESGVEVARALLALPAEDVEAAGGVYDNPARFRGLLLSDSDAAALRCRVSVLAPSLEYGDFNGARFGLENESARLNLNTLLALDQLGETAARDQLMGLPGMTESIADAILDWVDPDIEARQFGAELTYYTGLEPPYAPQNGPLESLDQLLMVRDVTPDLLYGLDRNRDLMLDATEATGELPADIENSEGEMSRGWSAYLTLYSAERIVAPDGEAKIDVNAEDLRELHSQLEQKLGRAAANFIVAYRQGGAAQSGPAPGGGVGVPVSADSVQIDFNAPGAVTIDSLMRLVGVDVAVVQEGQNELQTISALYPDTPLRTANDLLELLDYATVYSDETVPGRLNVNQSPRTLLASVPGMPLEAVEAIIGNRDREISTERPERRHAVWMYTEGYLTLDEMTSMMPLVTTGGDVYRGQFIGFFDAEGPLRRLEAVIDATGGAPAVVYQQDLSPLGGGPRVAELGAEGGAVEGATNGGLDRSDDASGIPTP
ncbi:MAG: hypothetical protein AAGB00_05835 [Planctomycetota bacterium]